MPTREPDAPSVDSLDGIPEPRLLETPESGARAVALMNRRLFGQVSPILKFGAYELVRTLGEGGSGTVYEALDRVRGGKVALKMLCKGELGLTHLQREFRMLAELSHPNLIALYELAAHAGEAYFTMELLEGSDIVSHVRADSPRGTLPDDLSRLRSCIDQLLRGLATLHEAGKLHGDLKPSNVLMASAGRVVVLDFGLAREVVAQGPGEAPTLAGTLAYMSPEQARGQPLSQASDFYSVGVMLYEMLTGTLPHTGSAKQLLRAKLTQPTLAPSGVTPGVPRDLDQLCLELLARSPGERHARGWLASVAGRLPSAESTPPLEPPFIARHEQLAELELALTRSRASVQLALVEGESGIGKSALVRRLLELHAAPRGALVFAGRCYERESVPFKGFDGIGATLNAHLSSLPQAEVKALLPPFFDDLVRVLPSLINLREAVERSGAADLPDVRAHAFEALRALLARLAERHPIILWLDDAQWGDSDGGELLSALLCRSDAPNMLVILNSRTPSTGRSAMLTALAQSENLTGQRAHSITLRLGRLEPEQAEQLARGLPGVRPSEARRLSQVSAGQPLFLLELARRERGSSSPDKQVDSFDALVAQRLAQLSAAERELLNFLSIAGVPLRRASLVRSLSRFSADAAVSKLSNQKWVHTSGPRGEDTAQLAHDAVRELIVSTLPPVLRRRTQQRILRALEADTTPDQEALLHHSLQLGLRSRALGHAVQAAEEAMHALAFARAATRYELALRLVRSTGPERQNRRRMGILTGAKGAKLVFDQGTLQPSILAPCTSRRGTRAFRRGDTARHDPKALQKGLADALSHSGQGLLAAQHYRDLAECAADGSDAVALYTSAAEQLMFNGEAGAAIEVMQRSCQLLGLGWPTHRITLELTLIAKTARWLMRRRRPVARASDGLSQARIDFLAYAWRLLVGYDVRYAIYFVVTCLEETAQGSSPMLRCQSTALTGFAHATMTNLGSAERAESELRAALRESELADPVRRAQVENLAALAHFALGNNRLALKLAGQAEQRLRSVAASSQDLFESLSYTVMALLELSLIREAERRWAAYSQEIRSRSDFMANIWVRSHAGRIIARHFPAGELAAIDEIVAEQAQVLERFPSGTLRLMNTFTRLELALYRGQGRLGLAVLAEQGSTFATRDVISLTHLLNFRGRVALCAAREAAPSRRRRLLSAAEAAARSLLRLQRPGATARGEAMLSSVAGSRGNPTLALHHIEACLRVCEQRDLPGAVAVAQHHLGRLIGGDRGRELIRAGQEFMTAQGILDPERWFEWCMPSAARLLEARRDS